MKHSNFRPGFLTALLVTALVSGVSSNLYAETYIKDIIIGSHNKEGDAKKAVTNKGYIVIDKDLNKASGGNYIYLGYTTTENASEAITNIIIMDNGNFQGREKITIDGYEYQKVSVYGSDTDGGDLNQDAGGADLFMWYSRSNTSSSVIQSIDYTSNSNTANLAQRCSDGFSLGDPCDLNLNAGGEVIYLHMNKHFSGSGIPLADKYFKVVDLGNGLYQIDVPLAVKDENGTVYHFAGTTAPSHIIQYYDVTREAWQTGFLVDDIRPTITTSGQQFTGKWQYRIYSVSSGSKLMECKTMNEIEAYYYRNYSEGGNDSDVKLQSFYWQKPSGTNISQFRYYSDGHINFDTSTIGFKVTSPGITPALPKAPEDMNMITITDPIIDMQATDSKGQYNTPGNQIVNGVTTGKMFNVYLYNARTGEFANSIPTERTDEPNIQNFQLDIPSTHNRQDFVALMYGEYKSISSDGKQSTSYQAYAVPFTQKPFHSLTAANNSGLVKNETEIDDNGVFHNTNTLTWKVNNISEEDVLKEDVFLIQRAYTSDFSDAQTLDAIYISDTSMASIDSYGNGTYTYIDNSEEGGINPTQFSDTTITDKDRMKVYYRVARSSVSSAWGNDYSDGQFVLTDSVTLRNHLAGITSISFSKKDPDAFQQDRTVSLHIELGLGGGTYIRNIILGTGSDQETAKQAITGKGFTVIDKNLNEGAGGDFIYLGYTTTNWIDEAVTNIIITDKQEFESTEHFSVDGYDYLRVPAFTPYESSIFGSGIGECIYQWGTGDRPLKMWYSKSNTEDDAIQAIEFTDKSYVANLALRCSNGPTLEGPCDLNLNAGGSAIYLHMRKIKSGCSMFSPDALIHITRFSSDSCHDNGVDYAKKEWDIHGNELKWDKTEKCYSIDVDDVQSLSNMYYYYTANVQSGNTYYYPLGYYPSATTSDEDANACYIEDHPIIEGFTATCGTEKGCVALEWKPNYAIKKFKLERSEYSADGEDNFETLTLSSDLTTSYVDRAAVSGQLYKYRLTASFDIHGKEYEVSDTVYGWNPYFGTISGKVQLKNGAFMPGKVTVSIKGLSSVEINAVKVNGITMIPGYSALFKDTIVTTDGTFHFENVPYQRSTQYEIQVQAEGAEFSVAGQEGIKTFTATLDDTQFEKTVDFVCGSTRQFSGRVLYENSTIPVRDCRFYMNGSLVLDANGNPVTTNSKGNFSFQLPAVDMNLQVRKNGHTFAEDGFVLGRNTDIIGNDSTQFHPSADYDGLILTDNTKVRLVGRMAGGDIQGSMPLGFGESKNNLGDNLKIVMELEGDNTSQIVYYNEHPDITTRQELFAQKVQQNVNVIYTDSTDVSFEKKRIVITPDVRTGEFCIDLPPTKYKITELSADGYPTLFNDDEGFQVLDLSNASDTLIKATNGPLFSTEYNCTYRRIHHNPVNLTYLQKPASYSNNTQAFYGDESFQDDGLISGKKLSINLAWTGSATNDTVFSDNFESDGAGYAKDDNPYVPKGWSALYQGTTYRGRHNTHPRVLQYSDDSKIRYPFYIRSETSPAYLSYGEVEDSGLSLEPGKYTLSFSTTGYAIKPIITISVLEADTVNGIRPSDNIIARDSVTPQSYVSHYGSNYRISDTTDKTMDFEITKSGYYIIRWQLDKAGGQGAINSVLVGNIQLTKHSVTSTSGTDVHYAFGYPVFDPLAKTNGDNKYYFVVSAHEDYYYNGVRSDAPDVVPVAGGRLRVRNGLEGALSEQEYTMGPDGKSEITVSVANPTFNLSDEDALRSLTMEVEVNGYSYAAEPLRAYVLGARDKGQDIITLDGEVNVLDVIRDPYGSKSYAYREAGTVYHWENELDVNLSASLDVTLGNGSTSTYITGTFAGAGGGAFIGYETTSDITYSIPFSYPILGVNFNRKAEYEMTLNTRIETSSDPYDVGADADVYVGTVNSYTLGRAETISIIDESTYLMCKNAIEAGGIRILGHGKDAFNRPVYIAISEKFALTKLGVRDFVYTQKHIRNVIIKGLVQQFKSMILTGKTHDEVQTIANNTKKVQYRLRDSCELELNNTCYETITPNEWNATAADTLNPGECINMINQWMKAIDDNESQKLIAIHSHEKFKEYSVSASTRIEHTESASMYDKKKTTTSLLGISINDAEWIGDLNFVSGSAGMTPINSKDEKGHKSVTNGQNQATVEILGYYFAIQIGASGGLDISHNPRYVKKSTAGSGFVIETNDNSYLDVDVYRELPYITKDDEEFASYFTDGSWDFVDTERTDSEVDMAKVHDFVFYKRGGAERNPWYEPDSTFVELLDGKRQPLSNRTLRIDNPKIYIENPVISNLPVGEKAIFQLRISNETELTTGAGLDRPSRFLLFLDNENTPEGVTLTIDGAPVVNGITFLIAPGNSITKTLLVERSGKSYDFDDIRLYVRDEGETLYDYATLSVHYLPSSTPVKITRPYDKWVMNTLSAVDEEGKYYIPVEVSGFDINYDNFDHIELQYKKHSDGDSKWINLCSYFVSDSLYQAASGDKEMLYTGTISRRFFGDMDPVEMAYDLRAVSYCRLGTGYVTKASEVISGTKDTRVPEIFGKPKPVNGILSYQDVISFPFNEPIAYNYLDETSNFQVVGYTNNSDADYSTSLRFPEFTAVPNPPKKTDPDYEQKYKEYQEILAIKTSESKNVPITSVKRSLSGADFTIEAMLKLDNAVSSSSSIILVNDRDLGMQNERFLIFGESANALYLYVNGVYYMSDPIDNERYRNDKLSMSSSLTHVAVTFKQHENVKEGEEQIRFYVDGVEIYIREDPYGFFGNNDSIKTIDAYGEISIGQNMVGNMADLRIWDKALSLGELMSHKGKRLTGYEPGLVGYWPMDEMQGNVLYDKAGGADMHFERQIWQMPDGQHSLALNGTRMNLQNAESFLRYSYNDFTLSFWVQSSDSVRVWPENGISIFQSGSELNDDMFRIYVDKNNLKMRSGSREFDFCTQQEFFDDKWHHVMVVANKTYNTAAMYYDGRQVQTLSGDDIAGMQGQATLGDDTFNCNIDNLTFWHLAIPSNNINIVRDMSPLGTEIGLVYYLPFEMNKRNSQNTWELVFSPYNEVIEYKEDGTQAEKRIMLTTGDYDHDKYLGETGEYNAGDWAAFDNSKSYPTVRSMKGITNLPFTWTSTDNELQVNIKKNDVEINHQNLMVTVRSVEDLAGNTLHDPQMMTVYVDRNVLTWDTQKQSITVPYGQGADLSASFTNNGGRVLSYTIENNNSWLTIESAVIGRIQPLASETVNFTIDEGLAPGVYSAVMSLIDENQLVSPLTINICIEASEPDWQPANGKGYSFSMNLMGRVRLKNGNGTFYDMDKRDIVGAFYNGVCVGKAYLTVDNEQSTSMVNMTIYGDADMNNNKRNVTFSLWRASTNKISNLLVDDNEGIAFTDKKMIGCPPDEPVIFTPNIYNKQTISLNQGWNWISLYVEPKAETGVKNLFESVATLTNGDRIVLDGKSLEIISGVWNGTSLDTVSLREKRTIQIYVENPASLSVIGSEYSDKERFVTLIPGTQNINPEKWNDLPYLLSVDQPVNIAMSDFSKGRAKVGTVIKSQSQFAVMDNDGKWIGSLEYMHPGEGYYVRFIDTVQIDVKYTNTDVRDRKVSSDSYDTEIQGLTLIQANGHQSSMPVIATLDEGSEFMTGDRIVAYSKGELAGLVGQTVTTSDDRQLLFITLNAEQDDEVNFLHIRGNEVIGQSTHGVSYDEYGVAGTLENPFVIDFSGKGTVTGDIYNLNGIRLDDEDVRLNSGIFIINGEKIYRQTY